MNLARVLEGPARLLYNFGLNARQLLPRKRCCAFGTAEDSGTERIEQIYVINLDRQPGRWSRVQRELGQVRDAGRTSIVCRATRVAAVDARELIDAPDADGDVDPFYTLADQLFVEPQPQALPDHFELNRPIRMSRPEVAVARSHVGIWRQIAEGPHSYALVLEDDVLLCRGFVRYLNHAWSELAVPAQDAARFDVLYLSYKEVKQGAQKALLSSRIFRPVRGLWYLSGYVLSREGAHKLLNLLPCRGPVDLWINHQFDKLEVRATRRSIIGQRLDSTSTNLYSILPALTKIGILNGGGDALFRMRPPQRPVFAFGPEGSGLSSLAMALSMLGYRCCSDFRELPAAEATALDSGSADRVFDAYVNVGSLAAEVGALRERYPNARFFVTTHSGVLLNGDGGWPAQPADATNDDIAVLPNDAGNKWNVVCEHLRCAPPVATFPALADLGQRTLKSPVASIGHLATTRDLTRDDSPWAIPAGGAWAGIHSTAMPASPTTGGRSANFVDGLELIDAGRWLVRDDTFPGNLALFRPANVACRPSGGATLTVRSEPLGVREYSAAAISSRDRFLYGRFEATLQATRTPGIVTGFFLHRDSPRQEIDVEIVGKQSDCLLVNVFYNPGGEGAKFDYGYRGNPSLIELGFDASEAPHRFTIEWDPHELRWLIDGELVHRRGHWNPTPIPHLPMTLHVNTWPSRSRELAGKLSYRRLPASAFVQSIAVESHSIDLPAL